MARFGRRLIQTFVLIIGLVAICYFTWHWLRILQFYLGPSEPTLAETGFDWEAARSNQIPDVFAFAPTYPFWSDGARKDRYIYIPKGSSVDTSNPDRWNFPNGTRIWKVFERYGVLVETRMLYKHGPEPWNWDMSVYQPDSGETTSKKLALGKKNVAGTEHDIPAPTDCVTCHGDGETRRPLGLTAFQIPWSSNNELSIQSLIADELLSDPPEQPYVIPGDSKAQAVLGYFDTNCGSCHYQGSTFVSESVPLELNLTTTTLSDVTSTNAYLTTINRAPYLDGLGTNVYIHPGSPQDSFLWRRMSRRDGGLWQMPPLATELVDEQGVELVRNWILGLKPPD